ncbi:MAG: rhomboid family intramembrane serine protease [candidate division KSB1 bacterium]
MIPLRDDNPREHFPLVNSLFIAVNLAIYWHQYSLSPEASEAFIQSYGAIPREIITHNAYADIFSSMFLHGGVMHLLGNLLYLFIFGDNVENLMGSARYFFFYIICGAGAALAHIVSDTSSAVPMVGASGAISGVLGAYMVGYPRARVLVFFPIFFFFRVPALIVLGVWFLNQVAEGIAAFGFDISGGIAWFAHIGGFLLGVILVKFFEKRKRRREWEEY